MPAYRILVVDDEPGAAAALGLLLSAYGHHVAVADGVETALHLGATARFDVLLADGTLQDGSGYELLALLRRHAPIAGVLMSGRGSATDRARSTAAGYAVHLLKPLDADVLTTALDEAVRAAR